MNTRISGSFAIPMLHHLAMGMMIPVLSLLQVARGLSLTAVGLNMAIYAGTVVVLELPTGRLADAIGRVRTYRASVAVQLVGYTVVALAHGATGLAVGFLFMGTARALSSGSMDAHFVDEFHRLRPGGTLSAFLARIAVWSTLGLAAGSLAGGYAPELLGPWVAGTVGGDRFSANILLAAVVTVAELIATLGVVVDRPGAVGGDGSERDRGPNATPSVVRAIIGNRGILALLGVAATWGVAFSGLEAFWQPHLAGLRSAASDNGGTAIFGYLTTGYFLAGAAGNALAAVVAPGGPRGSLRFLVMVRVAVGVGFVVLAFQQGVTAFAAVYLLLFALNGLMSAPDDSLFNERTPARLRSTLLSTRSLALQAGGAAGAACMGRLADWIGTDVVFALGGVVMVASALLYLVPVQQRSSGASGDRRVEAAGNDPDKRPEQAVPATGDVHGVSVG